MRRGSTRSTSRLATQPAVISPSGVEAEGQAVLHLGEPEHVLVDERRGRDVAHHHREGEREDRRVAPVTARSRTDARAPP